jgi:cbb3-type cytochrome oxidase maturation protein
MAVIYVILPIALVLAAVAVAAFIWAVRSAQMDDLETPAMRILHDDDDPSGGSSPRKRMERDESQDTEAERDRTG